MRNGARSVAVACLLPVAVLSACTSGDQPDAGSVAGIPQAWLTATADGWPSSDAHGGDIPVLTSEKCLLGDQTPQVLGGGAEFTDSGWGAYGSSQSGYRYLCSFGKSGSFSGQLQLLRASSAAEASQTLTELRTQKSTAQQDNSVQEVTSGQLHLVVLKRWYPTNPQGRYEALYLDDAANALVSLEVNSLSKADFAAVTPQEVADALVQTMAANS